MLFLTAYKAKNFCIKIIISKILIIDWTFLNDNNLQVSENLLGYLSINSFFFLSVLSEKRFNSQFLSCNHYIYLEPGHLYNNKIEIIT